MSSVQHPQKEGNLIRREMIIVLLNTINKEMESFGWIVLLVTETNEEGYEGITVGFIDSRQNGLKFIFWDGRIGSIQIIISCIIE